MKKIFLIFALVAFTLVSCDKNEVETYNPFTLETGQNIAVKTDIESFISSEIYYSPSDSNIFKSKQTNLSDEYNFDEISIMKNNEINQGVIMISNKNDDFDKLMFFTDSTGIIQGLRMEILEIAPNQTITFTCSDINGNQLFKANFDYINKVYNVLEIYKSTDPNLSNMMKMKNKAAMWGCNLGLGAAGLMWSTAFGMVTAGAGFVVGAGWLVFQTWACSNV